MKATQRIITRLETSANAVTLKGVRPKHFIFWLSDTMDKNENAYTSTTLAKKGILEMICTPAKVKPVKIDILTLSNDNGYTEAQIYVKSVWDWLRLTAFYEEGVAGVKRIDMLSNYSDVEPRV